MPVVGRVVGLRVPVTEGVEKAVDGRDVGDKVPDTVVVTLCPDVSVKRLRRRRAML